MAQVAVVEVEVITILFVRGSLQKHVRVLRQSTRLGFVVVLDAPLRRFESLAGLVDWVQRKTLDRLRELVLPLDEQ